MIAAACHAFDSAPLQACTRNTRETHQGAARQARRQRGWQWRPWLVLLCPAVLTAVWRLRGAEARKCEQAVHTGHLQCTMLPGRLHNTLAGGGATIGSRTAMMPARMACSPVSSTRTTTKSSRCRSRFTNSTSSPCNLNAVVNLAVANVTTASWSAQE